MPESHSELSAASEHEALAVRVSHMAKWFTDQSYEATTLREVISALRDGVKSSDGQLGEAGRAGVVADMGARPMSPAGVASGPSDHTFPDAQAVGMRKALEEIEEIAARPISGTTLQMKANRFDAIRSKSRAALASQPSPAATVEPATKSAPGQRASHNSGERRPSSDAAGLGADTQCSADSASLLAEADGVLSVGNAMDMSISGAWAFIKKARDFLALTEPQAARCSAGNAGCGTPGCTDPNCDYGKGPLRCQSCGAVGVGEPQHVQVTEEMLAAGAQALADDVWQPPQKFSSLPQHDQNKFTRQSMLVLKAATSPLPRPEGK